MSDVHAEMQYTGALEYPPAERKALEHAQKLEWLTVAYLLSVVLLLSLVLGSSQALRSAWLEDMLSLGPPIAFLIASHLYRKQPTPTYPYGFHGVVSLAFLVGAVALFALGAFLAYESSLKLIQQHHPQIGDRQFLGMQIWLGWLMIPMLLYSAVPAFILGRAKLPLARTLHDKVLYADAETNKADWMTATAAILGVLGIRAGFWWADSLAALLISLSILYDGFKNLRHAVSDLLNSVPQTVEREKPDPLIAKVATTIEELDWVAASKVRLREEGHVYFGEAFVVPTDQTDLINRLEDARRHVLGLDWRMHDLVITPLASLEPEQPDAGREK